MDDNELIINIEAIDDASETIQSVSDEVSTMVDSIESSMETANTAFSSMEESLTTLNEMVASDSASISDSMVAIGTSFDEAASMAQEATILTGEDLATIEELTTAWQEEMETSITGVGSAFTKLGGVALLAFFGIKSQVDNAVTDAQTWNQSLALIQAELKATGQSIPIDQLTAYATQVQKTSLFSDQQALAAEAVILSNKNLSGSYQNVMQLSEDLATKMGTDLPSAAKILAGAFTNPVDEMRKLVNASIPITPAIQSAITTTAKAGDNAAAAALLIDTLTKSIGGASDAASKSDGAGLTQFSNDLSTLNRSLGEGMLPALDAIVKDIEPIVTGLTAWEKENPKLAGSLNLVVLGLTGIAALMLPISLALPGLKLLWDGFAATMDGVAVAIGLVDTAIGIGLGAGLLFAIMGLVAFVNKNFNGNFAKLFEADWSEIKYLFDQLVSWIQNALNWLNQLISRIENFAGGAVSNVASIGSGIMSNVTNGLESLFNGGLGINSGIPHLAGGGIVNGATIAMIGESGPEAVIPLNMLGSKNNISPLSSGSGVGGNGGGNIIINVTGDVLTTEQQATKLGNLLAKQIGRQLKLTSFR